MKQGALIFDETADRYDIRFDLADYYGGLHCGECMEVDLCQYFGQKKLKDYADFFSSSSSLCCGVI